MDKKVTTRFTSSPAESKSPSAGTKNDSFLEDMEVFSHNSKIYVSGKELDHYVTRRTLSPGVGSFSTVAEEQEGSSEEKGNLNTVLLKVPAVRKSSRREISNNDNHTAQSGSDGNSAKESKVKIQESKSRNQDNKLKSKSNDAKISESQIKVQNEPNKLHQMRKSLVKDHNRRSGSCKETDHTSEASAKKEQTSNSHKNTTFSIETSKDRKSDGARKLDSKEIPESVALLSAVKEIVSTYTKEEGMKILRTLHELHIMSQASLLKNLIIATDEIRKDLQLGENLGHLKVLMAENERLRENFATLKMKNENLQRRLEESETIKEENARLKLRLQDLSGRKSS